ncbi:MAG: 50S ribosomal protein L10 [Promethearchaeota archaeon]
MTTETKKIPKYKLNEAEALKELINQHSIICLANMNKLGARQLQFIRKKLSGKIIIRMTKNKIFKIAALESNKKNIKEFIDEIQGSTSYIFTDMNPFKLKFFLNENKVVAPAKAGDIAPNDIVISEGSTGFPPGPMISEFKKVGVNSIVKQGSIYIKRDTVVVKKGDEISQMLALVLSRLNIKPMEIGLNLYAAYDNGLIIKASHLDVSLETTLNQIKTAISHAINLSLEIVFPTKENIKLLLQKAYMNAKSLVLSAGIITKDTIPDILAKAYNTALSLSKIILQVNPDALPSDLKQKVEKKEISKKKPVDSKKKEKVDKKKEDKRKLGIINLFDK